MARYILKRLVGFVPVLWVIITVTFFLVRMAPGGPFDADRQPAPEVLKQLEAQYAAPVLASDPCSRIARVMMRNLRTDYRGRPLKRDLVQFYNRHRYSGRARQNVSEVERVHEMMLEESDSIRDWEDAMESVDAIRERFGSGAMQSGKAITSKDTLRQGPRPPE